MLISSMTSVSSQVFAATMATFPANLTTTSGNDGVMEWWSDGSGTQYSSTPTLQYSKSSCESLQMLAEIHRVPPSFKTERFRDHLRRVVAGSAGDVATGMT